ncbi:MAG: hypothetical protein ACRCX2_23985, partial [Paraclostridium sp.]
SDGYLNIVNGKDSGQNTLSERLVLMPTDPFNLEIVYAVKDSGFSLQGYVLTNILGGKLADNTGWQMGINQDKNICLRHYYKAVDDVIPLNSNSKNFGEFITLKVVNDGTGITKFIVDEQETTFDFRTSNQAVIDIIQLGNLEGNNGSGLMSKFHLTPYTESKIPRLASPDGAVYEVSIDKDGVINSVLSEGSILKEAQLTSDNGTLFDLSIGNGGVLITTNASQSKEQINVIKNNFTLCVDNDGVLSTKQ